MNSSDDVVSRWLSKRKHNNHHDQLERSKKNNNKTVKIKTQNKQDPEAVPHSNPKKTPAVHNNNPPESKAPDVMVSSLSSISLKFMAADTLAAKLKEAIIAREAQLKAMINDRRDILEKVQISRAAVKDRIQVLASNDTQNCSNTQDCSNAPPLPKKKKATTEALHAGTTSAINPDIDVVFGGNKNKFPPSFQELITELGPTYHHYSLGGGFRGLSCVQEFLIDLTLKKVQSKGGKFFVMDDTSTIVSFADEKLLRRKLPRSTPLQTQKWRCVDHRLAAELLLKDTPVDKMESAVQCLLQHRKNNGQLEQDKLEQEQQNTRRLEED